jgi:hypothetical protein
LSPKTAFLDSLIENQVVDTMRNDDALSQRGKVVITGFEDLLTVHWTLSIEGAQELFCLRVEA